MNIDLLLQVHGEDAPSGEDLEYDPAFVELEIAAQPEDERQAGNDIIAGSDPDFKDVAKKALVVLERSHDLRAGVLYAYAQLRLKGLPPFAQGVHYLRKCLETYWDSCHPQLDADDDDDPTMRVNAMLALADSNTIVRGLRRAPLTASRTFGALSIRDIAVAEGEIAAPDDMETVPDAASVAAAFKDTSDEARTELASAAQSALEDVLAIGNIFDDKTPGQGPDLDPIIKILKQINTRLSGAEGTMADSSDESGAENAPEAQSNDAPVASGGGAINSPNDVLNTLDRIISYYKRNEPSSPVPMLLLRAKKLVSADFLTIVKDMAPHGVENVYLIGGIEETNVYDDD